MLNDLNEIELFQAIGLQCCVGWTRLASGHTVSWSTASGAKIRTLWSSQSTAGRLPSTTWMTSVKHFSTGRRPLALRRWWNSSVRKGLTSIKAKGRRPSTTPHVSADHKSHKSFWSKSCYLNRKFIYVAPFCFSFGKLYLHNTLVPNFAPKTPNCVPTLCLKQMSRDATNIK